MSRETEKLYEAITNLPDDVVIPEGAVGKSAALAPRRSGARRYWTAAACLCLVAGGVLGAMRLGLFGGMGAAGGGDGSDGTVFMSYAGPVFPLTAADSGSVTAARKITYDFAPYQKVEETYEAADGTMETYESSDTAAIVTDEYVLTNSTGEDVTLTAVYPFAGSLSRLPKLLPTVTVDGETADAVLHSGPYTGGFADAVGGSDPGGSFNLDELNSWEEYSALLSGGDYQAQALGQTPSLDSLVTVYEFGDFIAPAPSEEAQAPSLAIRLSAADGDAQILTYGLNSYSLEDDGTRAYGTFIPSEGERDIGRVLLAVVGKDIGGYTLQGYRNGSTEKGNELGGVSASVVRYETTLDALLRQLSEEFALQRRQWEGAADTPDSALLYRGTAELLLSHGALSDAPADRYCGMLEELLGDVFSQGRVFYLTFPVTVPAYGSASVTAALYKNGSHDFACQETENKGLQGYDLVTQLGSTLSFTRQSAAVETHGLVEIVRQNFGFDVANGITEVELDTAQAHYWMDVRRIDP